MAWRVLSTFIIWQADNPIYQLLKYIKEYLPLFGGLYLMTGVVIITYYFMSKPLRYLDEIVEAAGRYCDVVAINYYGAWTPSEKTMKYWGEWAQKPFIITEFYTKGMDSGLANTTGAGFTVQTQQERGYAYQHFVLGLLESGNCVGWHWFRYQDNDPTAKGVDPSNLDSNKGLVDNEYNLYKPLADAMKELNINAYRLADWFDQQSTNNK